MRGKTFTYFQDPGHGWVRVYGKDLERVKLKPEDFTYFSYQRGDTYFLEEDCDAGLFLKAWAREVGSQVELKSQHTNRRSKIRGYDHIASTRTR